MKIVTASFQIISLTLLPWCAYLLCLHQGGTDQHLERAIAWLLGAFALGQLLPPRGPRSHLTPMSATAPTSPTPQSPPVRLMLLALTATLLLTTLPVRLQLQPWLLSLLAGALLGAALPGKDGSAEPRPGTLSRLLVGLPLFLCGVAFPAQWRLPALVVTPGLPGPLLLGATLLGVLLLGVLLLGFVGFRAAARVLRRPLETPPDLHAGVLTLGAVLALLQYAVAPAVLRHLGQQLPPEGGPLQTLPLLPLLMLATWTLTPTLVVCFAARHAPRCDALLAFAGGVGLGTSVGLNALQARPLLMIAAVGLGLVALVKTLVELRSLPLRTFLRLSLLPVQLLSATLLLSMAPPLDPFAIVRGSEGASNHPAVGQKLLWTGEDAHTLVRVTGTKASPVLRQVPAAEFGTETQETERMAGALAGIFLPGGGQALVLGPGSGTALDALRLHNPLRMDAASPSRLRLGLLQLFGNLNQNVWKEVRIRPVVSSLRPLSLSGPEGTGLETYDAVIALTPPQGLERLQLYSEEGVEALARLTKDSGRVVLEVPLDETVPLLPLVRSFQQHFPGVFAWLPPESARQLLLTGTRQKGPLSYQQVQTALQRVGVQADLNRIHLGTPTALLEQLLLTTEAIESLPTGPSLHDNPLTRLTLETDLPLEPLRAALRPTAPAINDFPSLETQAGLQAALDQALERHRAWLSLLRELKAGAFSDALVQAQSIRANPSELPGQLSALVAPYLSRAQEMLEQGRAERAIEQLSVARIIDPRNAQVYARMADAYLRKGQPDQARPLLERALELAPDDLQSALALADQHRLAGKFAEAIQVLTPLLAMHPNVAILQHNLGTLYLAKQDIQQARHFFTRAIQLDEMLAEAHAGMAQSYLEQSRLQDAQIEADIAVRLKPEPDHLNLLGQILLRMGDGARARSAFVQCLLKNPDHIQARGAMGILYAEAGQIEQARESWEGVLAIDPKNRAAKDNLERLNREFPPLK